MPCPLGETVQSDCPHGASHVDYVCIGTGIDQAQYIFIAKDDDSSNVLLSRTQVGDASEAGLLRLRSIFF